MEYSLKMIKEAKKIAYEHLDNTPLVVPADCHAPETYNEAIARILKHSGVIDDGAYQKLRGIHFDGDFNDDSEDFDWDDDSDEFEQSPLAYYDDFDTMFPEPAPAPVASAQAAESLAQVSSDLTSQSDDVTSEASNEPSTSEKS